MALHGRRVEDRILNLSVSVYLLQLKEGETIIAMKDRLVERRKLTYFALHHHHHHLASACVYVAY